MPHTILISFAVVHLTMLRRAIRCLAPAGPAWTTFKSLVDQGAIPNVDAGKGRSGLRDAELEPAETTRGRCG
jgi:hypothetical protein